MLVNSSWIRYFNLCLWLFFPLPTLGHPLNFWVSPPPKKLINENSAAEYCHPELVRPRLVLY